MPFSETAFPTMFSLEKIELAYQHCKKITQAHYENFPVGSLLIPKNKRHHVYAVYAFARYADDIADEDYPRLENFQNREEWEKRIKEEEKGRLEKLEKWNQLLIACKNFEEVTNPVFIALQNTIQELKLNYSLFEDLLKAFKQDVCVRRYEKFEDLIAYSGYSANPVGRIILRVFNYHDEHLDQLSDHICSALQLANFWQDVAVDLKKNRIYIPSELLQRYSLNEEDLFEWQLKNNLMDIKQNQYRQLLRDLGMYTQKLFEEGAELPFLVKGRLSYELRATWWGGMTILKRACFNPKQQAFERPKINFFDKLHILWKSLVSTSKCKPLTPNP